MNKLAIVFFSLILAGCANTSADIQEPIECSSDCTQRYENV